jgi:hypothetical protein
MMGWSSFFVVKFERYIECIEASICHGIVALRRQGLRQKTIANVQATFWSSPQDDKVETTVISYGFAEEIARKQWMCSGGFRVSRSLVNARLLKAGLYARRPRRKVLHEKVGVAHQQINLQQ